MVRNRGEREDLEKLALPAINHHHHNSNMKDTSFKIMRLVLCLVVFVTGIVIGLISGSRIDVFDNWYTNSGDNNRYAAAVPEKNISSSRSENCTVVIKQSSKCEKVDCLSLENLIHPKELIHGLSDQELFWKATMVPRIEGYPFKRIPKVAFMFLTRGPLPFLPLWERFFGGHEDYFSIYVHTLPGFILNVSPYSVFFGRQIPSQVC